jgi:hypothetical protein
MLCYFYFGFFNDKISDLVEFYFELTVLAMTAWAWFSALYYPDTSWMEEGFESFTYLQRLTGAENWIISSDILYISIYSKTTYIYIYIYIYIYAYKNNQNYWLTQCGTDQYACMQNWFEWNFTLNRIYFVVYCDTNDRDKYNTNTT